MSTHLLQVLNHLNAALYPSLLVTNIIHLQAKLTLYTLTKVSQKKKKSKLANPSYMLTKDGDKTCKCFAKGRKWTNKLNQLTSE